MSHYATGARAAFDRDQRAPPALVCTAAMKPRALRRVAAAAAIVAGALLLWLSPETLLGVVLATAGIALEMIGIALDHA